ncbi:uncharacterized protein L203_106421 [Cryptococcus depauperatus CBS 7841]|uniref:Fungal-type protein kinase domain-containing protein n=1 Tax=Cryptococcus depauperatus CBS 7841 TaxID=1295531 RepID=A0AAJ8JZF5_9TREE
MSESDQTRSKIIQDHPIANGLDAFHAFSRPLVTTNNIDLLSRVDLQDITSSLLLALLFLPVSRLLQSKTSFHYTVRDDILRLDSSVLSDDFDFDPIIPLLEAALADNLEDALIWDLVATAALELAPPPRPMLPSFQQTPWLHHTSSVRYSSERRPYIDYRVLESELGQLRDGLSGFHDIFFGSVAGLETTAAAVFQSCTSGSDPLFRDGWKGWPTNANEDAVLVWFKDVTANLVAFAEGYRPLQTHRRLLVEPSKPIKDSTGERKLDIGLVSGPEARSGPRYHWSQILVPGELKSDPSADTTNETRFVLGRYAREVLSAQDTRRFVLRFTLCGSLMRVWEFDRLGGIASDRFDINKEGKRFVSTILGFLWMSEEDLGFDPTIITCGDKRYIDIERNGQEERIIIKRTMSRARCVVGRATTCWEAYAEKDPEKPLVIKDSWQDPERVHEGELLQEATENGVINVVRHYYHATVRVGDKDDDVLANIRQGIDLSEAVHSRLGRPKKTTAIPSATGTPSQSRSCSSSGTGVKAGVKRPFSETSLPLPPSKRSISTSQTEVSIEMLSNRVHRRVILCDYGKPIYKASSRVALLAAMERCIAGHESLLQAGFLHRDISINNLMIDEDNDNAFLIDLDHAIRVPRIGASGAKGKTGTRAFMAIGVLWGHEHSFMHDLESFFWVLFWICIHYDGPSKPVSSKYDRWKYEDDDMLVDLKFATIGGERMFLDTTRARFTPFYKPLIPLMNEIRKKVFPNDQWWTTENRELYSLIKRILANGQKDPEILGVPIL